MKDLIKRTQSQINYIKEIEKILLPNVIGRVLEIKVGEIEIKEDSTTITLIMTYNVDDNYTYVSNINIMRVEYMYISNNLYNDTFNLYNDTFSNILNIENDTKEAIIEHVNKMRNVQYTVYPDFNTYSEICSYNLFDVGVYNVSELNERRIEYLENAVLDILIQ